MSYIATEWRRALDKNQNLDCALLVVFSSGAVGRRVVVRHDNKMLEGIGGSTSGGEPATKTTQADQQAFGSIKASWPVELFVRTMKETATCRQISKHRRSGW